VAILVAVIGTGGSTAADFHSAWLITVVAGLAAGAALAAIGKPARMTSPAVQSLAESPA
jgi:hypothetical protein